MPVVVAPAVLCASVQNAAPACGPGHHIVRSTSSGTSDSTTAAKSVPMPATKAGQTVSARYPPIPNWLLIGRMPGCLKWSQPGQALPLTR